jgi:hypothetical protein
MSTIQKEVKTQYKHNGQLQQENQLTKILLVIPTPKRKNHLNISADPSEGTCNPKHVSRSNKRNK